MSGTSGIRRLINDAEALAPSGFAIAFHIQMSTPDFLFQTYPKAWIDIYSEKGYVMVDPIVRWGFTEIGHIRWSLLENQDDQKVLEKSKFYQMNFGVAISTKTGNSRSVAGFARPDREYNINEITQLTSYVQSLHDLTASKNGMQAEVRNELQQLSIDMTHPVTT